MFDGKSTQGWEPRAKVETFKAVDGELHLSSQVNVWVVSELQMGDFEVETEVMIPQENKGFTRPRLSPDRRRGQAQGLPMRDRPRQTCRRLRHRHGRLAVPQGPRANRRAQKGHQGSVQARNLNHFRVEAKGPRIRTFSTANLLPRLSTSNHSKAGSASNTTAKAARSSSATCARES